MNNNIIIGVLIVGVVVLGGLFLRSQSNNGTLQEELGEANSMIGDLKEEGTAHGEAMMEKGDAMMDKMAPAMGVEADGSGDSQAVAGADAYVVDVTTSTVTWSGKKRVASPHTGPVTLQSGSLLFDEEDQLVGGEFVADMTTIDSTDLTGEGREKLVTHLKSDDFFGVATYPTSSFVITDVTAGAGETVTVSGDFTLKGKTAPISFPATVTKTATGAEMEASLKIDRAKHDVRFGSGSFFEDLGENLIEDEFTLDVKLVASQS